LRNAAANHLENILKKTLFAVAIAAAFVVSMPASAQQKYQPEYRLSTVLGTAFPWGKGGERWAELVKDKTQGRINIKMYPGTSLVAGDQTLSAVTHEVARRQPDGSWLYVLDHPFANWEPEQAAAVAAAMAG